jgi:hypothetical protein
VFKSQNVEKQPLISARRQVADVTSCYTEGRSIFLQSETFDLGQITMTAVKANAGSIMLDNTIGA